MTSKEIISKLPYQYPFLFVDEIITVNDQGIVGAFTFQKDLPFYEGHFKDNPVTPGVILIETMAQIGLVAFGIYLTKPEIEQKESLPIAFTSAEMDFYKPVFPEEKVIVKSEKEYFRFNKLECNVNMYNEENTLVCRGKLAGMIKPY